MGGFTMTWDHIWQLATEHYIFHALVVSAAVFIIFRSEQTKAFLGRCKKIKAGPSGVELEMKDEPNHAKDVGQDDNIKTMLEKLKRIEAQLERNAAEGRKRNAEVGARLDKQYEYIREAALKSCAALVFADNVPLIEFFDAAFMNLYLGANGNTIEKVVKTIVKEKGNLSVYKSELAKFMGAHKNTSEHFKNAVEQIRKEWH
jgi:hypothetical protein